MKNLYILKVSSKMTGVRNFKSENGKTIIFFNDFDSYMSYVKKFDSRHILKDGQTKDGCKFLEISLSFSDIYGVNFHETSANGGSDKESKRWSISLKFLDFQRYVESQKYFMGKDEVLTTCTIDLDKPRTEK